ncbi:MAG: phosphotransferase family protein, partial [Methyloligellaceae bacterium]
MPVGDFEHLLKPEAESVPIDRGPLARHLAAQGFGLDPAFAVRQLKGGLANINYLVRVNGDLAVLRRPPGGELPPGAHDMAREHRILSVLWQALPLAPRSFHFTDDTSVIGVPFQLIEFRQGLVIRGGTLPPLAMDGAEAARGLATMLVETLAAIHAVDTAAIGLDDLGRPEGFVARAIAGWSKRGAAAAFDDASHSLVAEIAAWLGRQDVEEGDATLLHNDFKLDNMILEPETLAPVAVLDWDMGTRGDPRFDLATLLSYWAE